MNVIVWTGPISASHLNPLAELPEARQKELRSLFASSTNADDFLREAESLEGKHAPTAQKALRAMAQDLLSGSKCSAIARLVLAFNDWELRTYNQPNKRDPKRIGSAAFGEWANSLGNDPISLLAGKEASRVVLAGFSAAHGAHEVILGQVAANRDTRVVGLFAADSYYSAWGVTTPKPGFLSWLQFALEQNVPAWFTTSTRHPPEHPSATDSFGVMGSALDLRPVDYANEFGKDFSPIRCRGRGSVRWFDFGESLQHTEHATKLAPFAMGNGPFLRPPARAAMAVTPTPAPIPAPTQSDEGSNAGRVVLVGLTVLGVGYVLNKAFG